jgi:hypothetical protein
VPDDGFKKGRGGVVNDQTEVEKKGICDWVEKKGVRDCA